ncbi:MAG TPA: hydroxyphenylacetyl-CoA thioesterase PaaI [Saprospiraceae bacterium]|nr:hydroxyphenylacetyl-CoA thioesterase PaaI [Saprospiraceae bacterium]HND89152.1 hydroxyphenylacetyl-CoA thioesterase PaaI [Saprospiraceae bacterium]
MSPLDIFHRMYDNDPFSRWLGIELVQVGAGTCTLRMQVRGEMLNGFGVAHGGITFSLADSAFAFASNSRGQHALSVHCGVQHTAPVREGDTLTATAEEDHLGAKLANYSVRVENQRGETVALFEGMVYRKSQAWEEQ